MIQSSWTNGDIRTTKNLCTCNMYIFLGIFSFCSLHLVQGEKVPNKRIFAQSRTTNIKGGMSALLFIYNIERTLNAAANEIIGFSTLKYWSYGFRQIYVYQVLLAAEHHETYRISISQICNPFSHETCFCTNVHIFTAPIFWLILIIWFSLNKLRMVYFNRTI